MSTSNRGRPGTAACDQAGPRPSVAWRVAWWDRVLSRCREYLRGEGLCEVSTPVIGAAPAIEPHIEPLRADGGYLSTSPELPMKRLLCAGSGSIFQVAPAFRSDEVGARHRPEFRLLEWYRVDAGLDDMMRDVEALVGTAGALTGPAVPSWRRVGVLDRMSADLGIGLRGDETAYALAPIVETVSRSVGIALDERVPASDPDAASVSAWTELYSLWSTHHFDPWLESLGDCGVHLCAFPPALAALSRVEDGVAQRFESFVAGVELANGYAELADPREQRRRFNAVNAMREASGWARLPLDERFLSALEGQGLPNCAGVALGVDRLVMLAAGRRDLGDVALCDDASAG